ncbi:MAG: TrkA family potassium uptake protein [Spirochaetes bacterium]|nr:TrkA family potassium uptake protein [Spirochaetota bacterium]
MHIIIVGCGRVGSALAGASSRGGDDVVVIDTDPGSFRQLGAGFNGVTMRGTGCDEEQLREAGIERSDAFVAATDSDSVNMMAAEIALRIYHVPRVVVRLYEPEHEQSMRVLGLDYVNDAALSVQAILGKLDAAAPAGERQESA